MAAKDLNAHPEKQLALDFLPEAVCSFNSFIAGDNEALLYHLKHLLTPASERFFYLWGNKSCGKTHLLQALYDRYKEDASVVYLPLDQVSGWVPDQLLGLEDAALLCIDDVHLLAGRRDWEQALFSLYNSIRDQGHTLVVSAHASPAACGWQLRDLQSRLAWGVSFQVKGLDDQGKIAALRQQALLRGIELNLDAATYMVHHFSRDLSDMQTMLDELDAHSLADQRRLTIPYIKHIFSNRSTH